MLAQQPALAQGALFSLAANATTAEHFAQVDEAAADDLGLAWRVAGTRAARGDYDEAVVERLLERDPDPDAAVNALAVRASRNLPEAKEEAWHALYTEQSVPGGVSMGNMIRCFWRPEQRDVLLPFTTRYLEEIPKLAGGGMLRVFGLIGGMFPLVGDQAFVDAALAMAHSEGVDPTIRAALLGGSDTLVRQLRVARERARGSSLEGLQVLGDLLVDVLVLGAVRIGGERAHQRQRLVVPAQGAERSAHAPARDEDPLVLAGLDPGRHRSLEDVAAPRRGGRSRGGPSRGC